VAQDFTGVKQEMAAAGMGGPDSIQFINVIRAFREYGYSPSKILNAFAEVEEAREDIKQQKQEQRQVLDIRLEDLGFGDFEKLTQTVAALIMLAQYGIDCDKIISISQNLRQHREERRTLTDAYSGSDNNGGRYGYGYGYGYDNGGQGGQGY